MASMRRPDCCLFIILTCLVVSLIFSVHASLLGDTLTVGQVMKDWDFLESSNKFFQLLFFSPESSNNLRYLGIQFMNFSDGTNVGGQDKMVWVANRGKPLRGTLNISHDGNLMLTDYNGTFITINAEAQAVPSNDTSATLLDTGNLVLTAGKHIVWQSFDYPSDTWLPGMKLGSFKSSRGQPQHRFLTSQVSPQVPTLGAFTLGVDPNNTKQLVVWQRGVLYWRSGMWNGYNFSYFPNDYDEFNFSYFSNESQSYFTFTRADNDFPSWIDIDSSGNIRIFKTVDNNGDWWLGVTYYCDDSQLLEYNLGCVSPNPSNCTAGDVFVKKSGLINSWVTTNNVSQGISDCKEICRQDCSCTAYASALSDGSGCQFFYGEYSDSPDYIFYIRNVSMANIASPLVAPSYPVTYMAPHNPNNLFPNDHNNTALVNSRKKRLWFTISAAISLVIFILVSSLSYFWWRNGHSRRNNRSEDRTSLGTQSFMSEMKTEATIMEKINNGKKDHELPLFSLSSIEIATDYFSDANKIGQGGFGPVYKGKLFNGQEIAVKRLSRSSGQGLEEFKNEVTLISRLQHRNLVRILGCCAQGDERILVYEYLPNKSLDTFLFDEIGRALLDWKIRVSIIEGIAQGLQYLHKYSRVRIIHRDLKTSNILLDNNMNPKISDFGTARIFGDNESRANTNRIVGTYGYMSPEYALDGLFSVKSDVFSFGIMMLEIISGKKNTGFYQPDRAQNLLGYAWDLWKEGRGLEIIDHLFVETCSTSEVMHYIQVSFLCVQENAADRPTISDVVSMLSNELIAIPAPKQPAFSTIVSVKYANTLEIPKLCSVNDVTISEVEGR
ncbi:G-type lectin S-receptor-like serine/threonine-protein kinase At1g67520 isoform X1 [Camellia sinensis]|uniref:G-type lectin S-receptor-like serine/threonine-protein kinase At1g67520 isoform X1 n=1 Tax=Camellia sinensis TaxID=4442 RepID=UPI0010367C09|nr:G-type lectin S-receptor-like serine/threonine-protein kinase At1g67520 isoform X1 [Camellia sinensis]